MSLGPLEIGLIVLLIALVFGAKRLPGLGRAVGQSMREFKGGISGDESDTPSELGAPEEPKSPDGDKTGRP
jgi:sec-independent protein translocase protein TatA